MNNEKLSSRVPLLETSSCREVKEKKKLWVCLDAEEAKRQILISVPLFLCNVSYYSITLVSIMFAGHLGELELAGSTLGNSWATVTGYALMIGLSGALETLCGQGYGAKHFRMLGIYLQASVIISFLFSVIISVCWYYTEWILIFLHQDPEIAKMAGVYMKYLIPGLFAYGFLQCVLRFLQTQTCVMPLVACSLIPIFIHFGLTFWLVHHTDLGFKGSALGVSISFWVSFIMLVFYVNFSPRFKNTWEGLSMESFQYVLPSMKLALPSAMMVCLEYWAFEILVLLAGLMPDSEYTTSLLAMCVNTESIAYMITCGLSAAASIRVSNEIGAGNIDVAKNAVTVTLKLSVIVSLVVVSSLAFGHNAWASFFSDSTRIKTGFASITPLLVVSIFLDSVQGVLSGMVRGCGWQHLAVWTNLTAFSVIGMSMAILLGFKLDLHAKGLWIGLICGLLCQICTLVVITLRTSWENIEPLTDEKQSQELVF